MALPKHTRVPLRQYGKNRLIQETGREEKEFCSSLRLCPNRNRVEKEMVSTVRTLARGSLRRDGRGVARRVRCLVMSRGGDSNGCTRMAGCHACLRTVQQKNQKEQQQRRNLSEPMHAATLT